MTDEWWRLRPNEVAGTGDPHAERLTELLRERFGDAYSDMLIPVDPKARPMMWADFLPPQDAPALGFRTQPLIDDVPDTTPPKVAAPDPVADLVKAYKLIEDNPRYRPNPPGRDKWIRLADMAINPDTLDDVIGAGHATFLQDLVYRTALSLDGHLRDLPDGWSWCEHAFEWMSTDAGLLSDARIAFSARAKGHRLAPGEECDARVRRNVYGPMTPEIRRAAGQ